jgi:hypothetical protein
MGIAYEDEYDEEVDQRHKELQPSQLQDAPSLSLCNLQALGNAVHLTLSLQTLMLLAIRVRARLGGSDGL